MAPATPANNPEDLIERVADRDRIRFFLRRLRDERVWLDVGVDGTRRPLRSIALECDDAHGELLLDEFFPRDASMHLTAGHRVRIAARIDGGRLAFDTTLRHIDAASGAPIYRCAQPSAIRLRQSRADHRVVIGFGQTVPVHLTMEDGTTLEGRVFDVSASGMSIQFDDDTPRIPELKAGRIVPSVRLTLPGHEEELDVALRLQHVEPADGPHVLRAGGRFDGLERAEDQLLNAYVMACEREAARRRHQVADERP